MKRIIQIFTGGWKYPLYSADAICKRLNFICQQMPIDAVIIGWHIDPLLYQKVGDYLHQHHIDMYLWLPTFSEINELGDADPVIDVFGNQTERYVLQEGESFEFFCPSSSKNRDLLLSIYEQYFSSVSFDCVFLDKIRTKSYVAGSRDVLGCCCQKCTSQFLNYDYDVKKLRDFIEKEGINESFSPIYFDIKDGFHFKYDLVETFFDVKCKIYTDEIKKTVQMFRNKGLKVGLDVYVPVLSRLVGQDITSLLNIADFIKPMMYRRTMAPAGIGFEYEALKKALPMLPFDTLLGDKNRLESMSDEDMLEILNREHKEKIYPGIEVNYREDIAKTDLAYVKQSLQTVEKSGCGGVVYAWDIMLAPDEHLIHSI